MTKSKITTHILDQHKGKPASGVRVKLFAPLSQEAIGAAETDEDGRIMLWPTEFDLTPGVWTLVFNVDAWFEQHQRNSFFADISLSFKVANVSEHYHVPLLLNEFGYSSYRGS